MFEGLDWKGAFKRAAIAAALYLVFVYVMSIAFPDSFGGNLTSAVIVAMFFFFAYAPVFAFAERRKKRRLAELNAQKKGKRGARTNAGATSRTTPDGEETAGAAGLKGRHNPNTSRKKAARRRRR